MEGTNEISKSLKDTIKLKYFIVLTNKGYWGRGETLIKALRNADAINDKKKIKKDIEVFAYMNLQREEDEVSEQNIEQEAANGAASPRSYINGCMLPFVDEEGRLYYEGALIKLAFPI